MTPPSPETVVEYCVHNVTDRPAVDALPADTRGYPCLERCGRCRRTPFLVVDGTVLDGPDHAALAGRVREGVE